MPMYYPVIGIVTAASRDVADYVLSALPEWGHGTFGIELAPTSEGPTTHFAFGNSSATYEDSVALLALLDGTLPGDNIPWGDGGWPSEQDAIAACAPSQMQIRVYVGDDGLTPAERFSNWLAELELVRVEV